MKPTKEIFRYIDLLWYLKRESIVIYKSKSLRKKYLVYLFFRIKIV